MAEEGKTKKELLEMAKEAKIDVPANAKKEEIEAALIGAGVIGKDGDEETPPPTRTAPHISGQKEVEGLDLGSIKIEYLEGDKFNPIYVFKNVSDKALEVMVAGMPKVFKPQEVKGFTVSATRPLLNYQKTTDARGKLVDGIVYLGFKAR